MIIEFDSDYERYLMDLKTIDADTVNSMDCLLNSVVEERIFLKASYSFFHFLKDKLSSIFSKRVANYLECITNSYSTIMSEANGIDTLIMLTKGNNCECSWNCYSRCSLKDVPHLLYGRFYCENIDDAETYLSLFNRFTSKKNQIFLEKCSFCGGNIKTIQHALKENYCFFVVADSDIKYPDKEMGNTALQIKKLYSEKTHMFSTYYILNVHEKENLIPAVCLKKVKSEFTKDKIKFLDIIAKSNDDVKHYFDVKEGIKRKDKAEIFADPKWKAFYAPIISKAKGRKIYHPKNKNYILNGITSSGIERALPYLDTKDVDKNLTTVQRDDLLNIFKQIIRFGFRYINCLS